MTTDVLDHPASAPEIEYDPFSQEAMSNPLEVYKRMRRDAPVYFSKKYNGYFFFRFEDALELVSKVDNSLLQAEGSLPTPAHLTTVHHQDAPPPVSRHAPIGMIQGMGLPEHGRARKAHIKPMLPNAVPALTKFVRRCAEDRLEELLPLKTFDLTREYGGAVAPSVVLKMMGMPIEYAAHALSIINSGTRTDPEKGGFDSTAVALKSVDFFLPYVQVRRAMGADGTVPLVDGLINHEFDGRPLEDKEIARQLVCTFIGGIETVPKVVAHGLMELALRPDQLAAVRADLATNIPKVAEEMIRYCAPAQWFMRTAVKPVTIGGQAIKPGQRAFFMVASALRDEREFENPDDFVWNRPIPRVLSFGHGMHYCIGVHVARMEVRVLVEEFLKRVPNYHFDMDNAVRHPSSFQWGWNSLPVIID
jgi:cytochrome P450